MHILIDEKHKGKALFLLPNNLRQKSQRKTSTVPRDLAPTWNLTNKMNSQAKQKQAQRERAQLSEGRDWGGEKDEGIKSGGGGGGNHRHKTKVG